MSKSGEGPGETARAGWGHVRALLGGGSVSIDRLGAILTNWGVVLLGLVVAQGVAAFNSVLVARRVLPADYGQYLACAGLSSLLIVLPGYGMDNWMLAQGGSRPERVGQLWYSAFRFRVVLLVVWLAGMSALSRVLPAGSYPLHVLLPTAFALGCDSVGLLTYSALRLLGYHRQVTVLQTVTALAMLGVTLVLPLGPGRIVIFVAARAAVSLVAAVVTVTLARPFLLRPSAYLPAGSLVREAQTFMLGDLAVLVYSRADLALVALFVGATGAGIFGTATNMITFSFIAPNALYFLVMPLLSRAYVSAPPGRFLRLGLLQLALQCGVGLVLSAGMFWLAPVLIRLVFGSAYDASIAVLRFLSFIPFLKSVNFGLGACLTSAQRQPQRTRVQMLCALFNAPVNWLVVGPLGLVGVACVDMCSEALLCLGYGWAAYSIWRRGQSPQA